MCIGNHYYNLHEDLAFDVVGSENWRAKRFSDCPPDCIVIRDIVDLRSSGSDDDTESDSDDMGYQEEDDRD
eukprot:4009676-Karenia_brevis.AAC.1